MTTKTSTASTTAPLYVQFASALKAKIAELGLPAPVSALTETGLPQNKGYFFVRFSPEGAALIVPKSVTRMGTCDVHIDVSGLPGGISLAKPNGKVMSRFTPDADLLGAVLARLNGASKRATAVPVRTPVTATAGAPVASQDGSAELASWADREEDVEAELARLEARG